MLCYSTRIKVTAHISCCILLRKMVAGEDVFNYVRNLLGKVRLYELAK